MWCLKDQSILCELRKKQISIDLNADFAFNILANLFVDRDQIQ